MISHQFYSRNQRSVFAAPPVDGEENMAVYGSTREPEEEESAIAPYGSDISVYNQIAGPSSRVNADGSRKMSDAGLDIDGDAIRHLQVGLLHQHIFHMEQFQGRRREDVQFIEAKVDASLGNIRENIRKGANQKHISTSMVDPLKQMKKSGMFLQQSFCKDLWVFIIQIQMLMYQRERIN